MADFFRSDEQRAVAFAAYKLLEVLVGKDGLEANLPPGFDSPVGDHEVTVVIPDGIGVTRALGTDGKGHIFKKATQNLYGWNVWALFLKRLSKFNQAAAIKRMILESMREALANPNQKVADELQDVDPELAAETEKLKAEFRLPDRSEDCPRRMNGSKGVLPTVIIKTVKAS